MGRLAWCGLLLLQVGASFGALADLEGGGGRVLALPFNSEVETAWRPPRPHWSGQLQAIGRRQRRHLTRCLNRAWSQKQGPSLRLQGGRHWSGWPLRGQRVGEAQHPGPQAMLVDAGAMERERSPPRGGEQARVFCPVDGCPASNPRTARGWGSHAAMRPHLDDHAAGTLQGAIPAAYCAAHSLDHCRVCGLLVAARFNGAHPRCRPAARDSAAPAAAAAAAGNGGGPDMAALFLADIPVLRHVPKVARASCAQCLARALAAVAHHNSAEAWWDLLMLPKAVLRPAPRGGALRRQQAGQFTLRRCGRWLGGEREELLEAHARPRGRRPARRAPEDSEDPVVRAQQSRCCALAGEGELSRACAALAAPPLLNHAHCDQAAKQAPLSCPGTACFDAFRSTKHC